MPLNELTILYVEDEKYSRKLLGLILLDFFKEVYLASNAKEAIEIYKEKKIDIVLSDISMPIMDGIEMSSKIKEIKGNQAIILLTASQNHKYLERAINIGVYRYILKPIINQKEFINTLKAVANIIKEEKDNEKHQNQEIKRFKLTQKDFYPPTVLYKAYKNNEFEVYYQPQIDLIKNKCIAIDALIRWNSEDKVIYPSNFILGAIRVGMMPMIDEWVLQTSIKQIANIYNSGINPGILSVNLRMKSLEDKNFIGNLKNILTENKFKANLLEFKIREHNIMLADNIIFDKIKELSKMGVRISIANFGKGFTTYIKKIPINKIKIHKSYIDGLPNSEESILVIKAILELGKRLNIDIVAEGVEKENQLKLLIKNNVSYAQGFLFSKATPLNNLIINLKRKNNK